MGRWRTHRDEGSWNKNSVSLEDYFQHFNFGAIAFVFRQDRQALNSNDIRQPLGSSLVCFDSDIKAESFKGGDVGDIGILHVDDSMISLGLTS